MKNIYTLLVILFIINNLALAQVRDIKNLHHEKRHTVASNLIDNGSYFNAIYEDLNKSKHRLKREEDDKIRKQKINFNFLKKRDIDFAKDALLNLQEEFASVIDGCKI